MQNEVMSENRQKIVNYSYDHQQMEYMKIHIVVNFETKKFKFTVGTWHQKKFIKKAHGRSE